MNSKHLLSSTWGVPIILFALSIFGLLSALTGDALWDVLSWLTLGVPLLTICWSFWKSGKS